MTFDDYLRPDIAGLRAADEDRAHIRRIIDEELAARRGPSGSALVVGGVVAAAALGGVALYLAFREDNPGT